MRVESQRYASCWDGTEGRIYLENPKEGALRRLIFGGGGHEPKSGLFSRLGKEERSPVSNTRGFAEGQGARLRADAVTDTAAETNRVGCTGAGAGNGRSADSKTVRQGRAKRRHRGFADEAKRQTAFAGGERASSERSSSGAGVSTEPATFREFYCSKDGRFLVFEDASGHLTSVDASRLV